MQSVSASSVSFPGLRAYSRSSVIVQTFRMLQAEHKHSSEEEHTRYGQDTPPAFSKRRLKDGVNVRRTA
jgi:hypothetical protein